MWIPRAPVWISLLVLWIGTVAAAGAQNVILVIADDMDVGTLAAYGEQPLVPPTPTIDGLAAQGVLFRNAWATPVCSPFRATVISGLHPAQHGVGFAINGNTPGRDHIFDHTIPNLASVLGAAGYRTAALGKWHLATSLGFHSTDLYDEILTPTESSPMDVGFDYFAGHLFGALNYYSWPKTTNGVTPLPWATTYATTDTVNEAVGQLSGSEPFFLWVAFNAPHSPLMEPPSALLNDSGAYNFNDSGDTFRAMIEAMDTEMGRLLASVDFSDTTLIFVADNGTVGQYIEPPILAQHGKATLYEGGVNVPLIIRGQAVAAAAEGGESGALVQATDLFATILEIAGVNGPPREDAISLVPYLVDPATPSLRETAFTESYVPNGGPPDPDWHDRAARNERYKLTRFGLRNVPPGESADEFYDLVADPYEQSPISLASATPEQEAAYFELHQAILERQVAVLQVPSLSMPGLALLALLVAASALSVAVRRRTR